MTDPPSQPATAPSTPAEAGPETRSAFVTGGTGFLGLNLVEQLTADGWQVTALHRKGTDPAALTVLGAHPVKGDILDLDAFTNAVPEDVDAVFHMAADTSLWARNNAAQMRTNIDGTRNAVTAARRRGARKFVFTSSWSAWGYAGQKGPATAPTELTEDAPMLGDRSWINYDRTKYFADHHLTAAIGRGLDAVTLSPCHIMGRYDRHNWSRLIRLAVRGRLPGIPPGHGEFCHAEAVARAHIAAVDRGRTGANYLLGGPSADYAEIVRLIGDVSGKKITVRRVPPWLFRSAAHLQTWWGNLRNREPTVTPEAAAIVLAKGRITSRRAADELGYASPDLRTMIEDCYTWMEEAGLL